jgi:hypothetical protein
MQVLQRFAVLWLMALLVGMSSHVVHRPRLITRLGYTANASAIKLGSPASTEAAGEAVHVVIRSVLAEVDPSAHDAVSTHHERDPALVTATAFFLVAKFSRVALLMYVFLGY